MAHDPAAGEPERVEAWREHTLLNAGYPADDAHLLARRTDIDLHHAINIVAAGCPVRLAVRILT